jgi:hypothetical protein
MLRDIPGPATFPRKDPYQGANVGGYDAFITKLDSSGSALIYSTYLGGSGTDYGYGIAVDASGNAYVTGITVSDDFPTKNPYQATRSGFSCDVFITKLDSSGSALAYSTYLGGSGEDEGYGIAVDGSGNAYVTGETRSNDFPTQNPYQGTRAGSIDAFITKVSLSGTALTYSTYLGGSGNDNGRGIAVDASGNAYVTGKTYSDNFPTQDPYQATRGGFNYTVFITKLDSSGSALAYSTYLGGSGEDNGYGIAVDGSGNAYVTGYTSSDNFPTQNPYQGAYGGNRDAFVAKLGEASTPTTPIPTLNEWGLIILSLLLIGIGYIAIRRRESSSV